MLSDDVAAQTMNKMIDSALRALAPQYSALIPNYGRVAYGLVERMTPGARLRWLGGVDRIHFYSSLDAMRDALGITSAALKGGLDSLGVLHLDGGESPADVEHIYAHEFSHGIDHYDFSLSSLAEWDLTWAQEIRDGNGLSKRARADSHEGFAEFGRIVLGGLRPAYIEALYPQCYNFWHGRQLVP